MALVPTRFETATNWASSTVILTNGEVGIETDTGYVKTGDGVRIWSALPKTDDQETSAVRAAKTSDETGTGAVVLATSPTIVTPTLSTPTLTTPVLGVATATSVNKVTITAPATSATLTLVTGSSLITAGAYAVTLTSTATTGVTLPTTGTLATLAGSETFTNKTLTSPIVTTPTITGAIFNDGSVVFEGATANDFETTVAITDPTADRTITLPDLTGTVSLVTATETLTNKTLTSPTVAWSVATPAASATQTQGGGTAITAGINRVATITTTDDAVTLPVAAIGQVIKIKNAHATNQLGVFPAVDGYINALAQNAVYALPALKMVEFNCAVAGTWDTILTA